VTAARNERRTAGAQLRRSRYGKDQGHPAGLDLADCMSHACVKARGVMLLYKGDDFALADLA
jgi:ribonuclease VapC